MAGLRSLGFRVQGLGIGIWGFRVLGLRVYGFRVGLGFLESLHPAPEAVAVNPEPSA